DCSVPAVRHSASSTVARMLHFFSGALSQPPSWSPVPNGFSFAPLRLLRGKRSDTSIGCRRPLLPPRLLASLNPRENIYTVPNILTFSRLLSAPVIGYLIVHEQHLPALVLFVYAGITDFVDGWIARKWKLQTVVGTVIDPMADKTLMTVVTVCLAVKAALPGSPIIHGSNGIQIPFLRD
ncbi:hypothetical protein MMC29_007842, partial [Sticta canariensis]|nr:hypothetical protein [Sticta canariensis]